MKSKSLWLVAPALGLLGVAYSYTRYVRTADSASSVANSPGSRVSPTLQLVIVVTRHGHRPPLFSCPGFPYTPTNSAVWPYGPGELTGKGRAQMYELGKEIRSLYNGFLKEHYHADDFKASSTLKERSMMSAELFLAGMFPPRGFQVWDKHLPWQPVPVYPNYLDHTEIVGTSICPRYMRDRDKSVAKLEQDEAIAIKALNDSLRPHIGPGVNYSWFIVLDSIIQTMNEGLPLPEWTKEVYPEPLSSVALKYHEASLTASDTTIRLLQGPLFTEMIGLMEAKASGSLTPDRRMFYYSGHDHTISGLKAILGLRGPGVFLPNTGSALIFELHKEPETGVYSVQVLYIEGGSSNLEPVTVEIPGSGSSCRLDLLKKNTEKYCNITDWNKECQ